MTNILRHIAESALILVTLSLSSSAFADQFVCTTTESCWNHSGCSHREVPNLVTIDEDKGRIYIGSVDEQPEEAQLQLDLVENSNLTLWVGISGATDRRAGFSMAIFNNLEFTLTGSVTIIVDDRELASGLAAYGKCERALS
ncbi:hypothetical protein SLH49_13645 [Cognatiyoonia sp. IB215446]|uniref:hypothetical protein n=1 Tax=Cognatiyoonia sp. IB215446 TaxID=3097355 RepID=UPI002A184CE1|nr:hypothetical protein [Cognatiyoonia sp. IB215446]MDX8349024.1 hypothetical protein [Cognatiyoonia sp. IB215446]